ncbi:hypothetical protein T05_6008 [Trichinella murrelli]|uniref:Uncharacterized protein n=1 Tax=Trichinella murrelli TaxID=144512 RepID=A0A0V0T1C9_9BILA|nr:hypothetical protein T05_6008 [Trichinella murrelli]
MRYGDRAFNMRLLLFFLTCTGAKPVELHGMHYWHILQDGKPPASSLFTIAISFTASGDWYFLSWFLLTHVAKHGERERAKQLFGAVEEKHLRDVSLER